MAKLKSVMTHQFSQVPRANIPRSSFDRSHGYKATFDSGYLVPVLVDEALPGDTFSVNLTGFARLATPIHPIMDNMFMDTQFFAVPLRLLWDNWEKFNGAQDNPGDSTDFLVPQVDATVTEQDIFDYMGLPLGGPMSVAAWAPRAYNLIWNEWYRDQNLQDSIPNNTGDGPDVAADYVLQRRGKRHDYFTSCLPWPQKGDSVDLPLGSSAPIVSLPGWPGTPAEVEGTGAAANDAPMSVVGSTVSGATNLHFGLDQTHEVDLSNATAATVNSLRQAFQLQRMAERDARGGTRYTEIVRSHFGVMSPDARLQRPEYLGGGSSPVIVSPVAQTESTQGGSTPQGSLAGIGTASLLGHGFTKSFTEHCVIIGLVSVRADLTYQQGIDRMWSRQTRNDFYWPALSHIGEQAVLNKEIFWDGTANDDLVFGYQERYAEYRYKPSRIAGRFRSKAVQSLDAWHLSQEFANLPTLSSQFIEENPPVDRIVAITTEPQFIFDSYINMRCARPMPLYGVPGLIDHF